MLGHVICDVCAICIVLSEIGRRGNSEILRKQENLSPVLQQRNLIVFSRSREVYREHPACSTNSQRLDTRNCGVFLLYKPVPCLAFPKVMTCYYIHEIHCTLPFILFSEESLLYESTGPLG